MTAPDFWSRMSAAADRAIAMVKAEEIARRLRSEGLSDEKIAKLERWITHEDVQKAR